MADYIDQLKILSHDAHSRLADLILKALLRPLRYESGNSSFEHCLAEALWGRLCSHLTHEADIRLYEPCVRRMHSLACEEDEAQFFNSCLSFWTFVTQKAPDVAANYVEDFFADVLDRKQVMMTSLLPVSTRREDAVDRSAFFH